MKLNIRRTCSIIENKSEYGGRTVAAPVRKVAVVAVLENPFASKKVDDLSPLTNASVPLGAMMAQMALDAGVSQGSKLRKGWHRRIEWRAGACRRAVDNGLCQSNP
jgi:hypothetical protein